MAIGGTVLGAVGAFALTRYMSTLCSGVSSVDALTFRPLAGVLGC